MQVEIMDDIHQHYVQVKGVIVMSIVTLHLSRRRRTSVPGSFRCIGLRRGRRDISLNLQRGARLLDAPRECRRCAIPHGGREFVR
jgi:hypothetical protein